jgi:thiamine biosynthesis lipoprotein
MGTEFTWTIYPREGDVGRDDLTPIADEAFGAVDALEDQISTWIASSNASDINKRAAMEPVHAAPRVLELLEFSMALNRDTNGAFDVTVGPLVEVRKQALAGGREPTAAELAEVLPRVGMDKVLLDPAAKTVQFAVEGIRLDFGGVGKGMALDLAVEVMRRYGVKAALLSGGDSSMYALGSPPGYDGWQIAINNPYDHDHDLGRVVLHDESLSTSACYHALDGSTEDKPCGIFDPRTGLGVTGMVSTTVIAPTGIETDALSTACYVLGVDGIEAYCAAHPGVRAVAVERPLDGVPKPVHIGVENGSQPGGNDSE